MSLGLVLKIVLGLGLDEAVNPVIDKICCDGLLLRLTP